MKPRYKKLLSLLGAISLISPMIGCEADAEEVASDNGTPVVTNITDATVASGPVPQDTAAPVSAEGTVTNLSEVATAPENTNQPPVVVQRIPASLPADVQLSKGVQEVAKLLQSGVSETVVLLFIEKATEPFALDAADIVYLNDIGVSPAVLAAMLNHDGANADIIHDALSTNQVPVATAPPAQLVPGPSNQIANLSAAAPAPAPVEVSSNYVAAPQYGATAVTQDPNAQAAQQPVIIEQPAQVVTQPAVTYSYFYNSLSPYGSWVYVSDYGWCWQPTIAVTHYGWRPYAHGGRWLYSDVGWYWHSDYSWGWAPFHYGRWYCAPRVGWVWTPDYVWGPSWVTWRSSGAYCGWAPLPPRCGVRPGVGFSYWGRDVGFNFSFGYSHDYYTFVPANRFCDRRIVDHAVPTHRSSTIYKDSTVVNNYIVGNNNTIINNGVGRDFVASHTRGEIPRVRVAESSGSTGRIQPDRLVRNGAETVVYRPQRPSANLEKAHQEAVARTRSEVARPANAGANDPLATRRNMITSRPGAVDSTTSGARTGGGGARAGSSVRPAPTTTVPTRNEPMRPEFARGETGVPAPVMGRPAPIRPEPDRSAELVRTRTRQESVVRPGSQVVGTPSRSEVPRLNQTQPARPGGSLGTVPQSPSRPGGTVGSSRPGTVRNEVGRGSTTPNPTTPSQGVPPATRNETGRPGVGTPSSRPSSPATSPSNNRPSRESSQGSGPVTLPSGRNEFSTPTQSVQSEGAASTPQLVRPRSTSAQSPVLARSEVSSAPVTRTAPNNNASVQQTVRPSVSNPTWSRQSALQQGTISATPPQPVQRTAPTIQNPAVTGSSRSENFSRPAVSVQRSTQIPNVVQPQRVAPVQPQRSSVAPQAGPSYSAPVRSAPVRSTPNVESRPAPVYRSAPSSPPPSSSRSSAQPQSSGRGRLEIGR